MIRLWGMFKVPANSFVGHKNTNNSANFDCIQNSPHLSFPRLRRFE